MSSARLRRRYRHPPWYPWRDAAGLVAMDLGKRKVGVAVFDADGTLTRAATVHSKAKGAWTPWRTCDRVAERLLQWGVDVLQADVVCEMPRLRGMEMNKDIDSLIRVGGVMPEVLGRPWDEKYAPSEWKKQVEKGLHHRRIRESLTDDEASVWDGQGHDARDAIGIGLFALGRIDSVGRCLV